MKEYIQHGRLMWDWRIGVSRLYWSKRYLVGGDRRVAGPMWRYMRVIYETN